MGVSQNDGRMEGWLFLIRSNRFGLQYSRKRYFVLEDHYLKSFKSVPISKDEVPVRSAIIDSCIRATDNGRESIHRKVFFIFTLYNTSNHNDQLKLGASSPEEAARWMQSFQEAALKAGPNTRGGGVGCSKSKWPSFRLICSNRIHRTNSIDWTLCSSTHMDPMTSDVIAPSPWTIFGCQNGLRLFKEAKDRGSHGKWDDHPAIMAVGVVDGTSEAIFQTLMSLGPSRSEWDFCFYKGNVVEHLDGHTDIVHKQLYRDWLPWLDSNLYGNEKKRSIIAGVILYHSVIHKKCPPQRGYVRACLKSGGYVVSPVNQGKQSVVKHMLAIDWKFWRSYLQTSSARSITIRMLGRVAALRELFRAKLGNYPSSDFSSGELTSNVRLPQSEQDVKTEAQTLAEEKTEEDIEDREVDKTPSEHASLVGLNDAADEFFDVPEPSDSDLAENGWPSDFGSEMYSQVQAPTYPPQTYVMFFPSVRQECLYASISNGYFFCILHMIHFPKLVHLDSSILPSIALFYDIRHPKLSTAAGFVKKLHDLAIQKRGYMDLQEVAREDRIPCCYGATLPKDPTCNLACSWTEADPSTFLIRGKNYLEDHQKVKAKGTLMKMVAADWLRSDKREDDLGGRPESIVQKYAAQGGPEFFFIVNIQVPGSTTYSLALYYMMNTPVEDSPLLESFIKGDDAYRNSRFKLIPYISQGSWIVKQSVGKKACLVGQALEINYFHGKNYLELGIDIGSSTVARGVVSLVLGYLNNLVIEMTFLIQANTPEELPEYLLGTCRLNHLDASKSVLVKP
ncbi:Protein enhanced disease resistance 2 [Vitis vinifera]|uniref:Protein enhanced disease resistance 2 n=1 Tax=Vitis vinifera TaxID=29760 RepID=A0A438IKF5_VITVI|nr:Protein enhanced disease resistance 2 [Vitis vinifera]